RAPSFADPAAFRAAAPRCRRGRDLRDRRSEGHCWGAAWRGLRWKGMAGPSRGTLFEEQRRERGSGGLRSGPGDGDVGEAIWAHALLHEMDEALLESAHRGLTEIGKLTALGLG